MGHKAISFFIFNPHKITRNNMWPTYLTHNKASRLNNYFHIKQAGLNNNSNLIIQPAIKNPDYIPISTFVFSPQQSIWVINVYSLLIYHTEKQLGNRELSQPSYFIHTKSTGLDNYPNLQPTENHILGYLPIWTFYLTQIKCSRFYIFSTDIFNPQKHPGLSNNTNFLYNPHKTSGL